MNAGGGQGQGGQGGAGSGAGSGGQNNGQETTTTSAQEQQTTPSGFITTTANPHTQTTTATNSPTSTSTSTSSSSSSSSNQKTAIIGGVIGGIAGLLLIALLAIYLLNRRQKKRITEKRGSAEPVTYANLNNSFAGVPFDQSNRSSQNDSLLPAPLQLTPNTNPSTPRGGVGIRGGEGRDADVERNSGDYFLPTYAESQAGMSLSGARSLGRLNTSNPGSGSEATISPMSIRHPGGTPTTVAGISPQTTGGEIPLMMPQVPRERDTMGFPVDAASDIGIPLNSTPNLPIVAPVPRHPLVQQDSLERVAREGMNETPEFQNVNLLGPRNGPAGRVLSQELMRESPVLGQMNPVRMQGTSNSENGVQRFESQRTVSSVSSMGVSIVSDTELERLGVGSRGRHLA